MREVICAFCKGKGKDPFGLLSKLAACQVCGGTGKVKVEEPLIECAFCKAVASILPLDLIVRPVKVRGALPIEEKRENARIVRAQATSQMGICPAAFAREGELSKKEVSLWGSFRMG